MSKTIRLGISTCPNDTFAFHGLIAGLVDTEGLDFQIQLLDIQQLNEGLIAGDFDVAKASFHAAVLLADRYQVLPSGSALGFGVGPLLLSSQANAVPNSRAQTTLCPGRLTTAALLYQLFYPDTTRVQNVVFSDIMPLLQEHKVDFGVCIHEGRFTWEQAGLYLVEDLGTRWERETHSPLPLGGIVADRSLDKQVVSQVQKCVADSLRLAMAAPELALPTMRKYAQEFDDNVLAKHVELYVNKWTVDLGEIGRGALMKLSQLSKTSGIVSHGAADLQIFYP